MDMPSNADAQRADAPLAGVRVVDLSDDLAAPFAAALLGDLGAEVIKVEGPSETGRRNTPESLCFGRNRLSVSLDVERPEDCELARQLVASADVLITDRDERWLRRYEFDAIACHARNPALVHASVWGWGVPREVCALPVDETLLLALNGAAFGQFSDQDVPVHLVTPLFRYANGIVAASAIAAALYARERTRAPQTLCVSALHASAACLGTSAELAGTAERGRAIGAFGTAPNYKLFRCADSEWLFLAALLPHQFEAALKALGLHAEILAMPGVDGKLRNALMRGVGGRVRARLEAAFAARPRSVWLELLHAHDVPVAPCGSREQWFDGEQVEANGLRAAYKHPELGEVEVPGPALEVDGNVARGAKGLRAVSAEGLLALRSRPSAHLGERPALMEHAECGPLHGVEVLDLGTVISTPFAAAILASFGAKVIKLEATSGDSYRNSPGALAYNRDKRSLALDLKGPAGRRVMQQLCKRVDVVCDNFRAGVMGRLGLTHSALSASNPRLISASVTAFGERGPLCDRPGFDPLLQAMSGLMLGQGGGEPVFHQIPVNDVASGMMLSLGIGAALFARERSGRGRRVTTSLAAQACILQSVELTRYRGRPPAAQGGRDCAGLSPVRRFYRCADGGFVAVACRTAAEVTALYEALRHPEWAEFVAPDAALAQPVDASLATRVAQALAALPAADAVVRLTNALVPAARALRPSELDQSPLHVAHRYFDFVARRGAETALPTARAYAEFASAPSGFRGCDPELGEHTREILRELGLSDAEVDDLVASRQCVTSPPAVRGD